MSVREIQVYVVEVCRGCGWNHLVEQFLIGRDALDAAPLELAGSRAAVADAGRSRGGPVRGGSVCSAPVPSCAGGGRVTGDHAPRQPLAPASDFIVRVHLNTVKSDITQSPQLGGAPLAHPETARCDT